MEHHDYSAPARIVGECERVCSACATHCGEKVFQGDVGHYLTSRTCLDCAAICGVAVQIISRGGPYKDIIAEACAAACGECATACEVFSDDEHMAHCAETCRQCAKACLEVVGMILK